MHRLSGEDSGFLSMDLPGQPMCTMAVGTLSPDDGPALTLEALRAHLAGRLDQLPSFRWRIVPVPLGLHHPVAVEDPDFDLDFHLRSESVAAPGGPAEVDELFASIAERHLDPRHPLWQATLVDDLDGDRQALVLKYHHCLADGVGALTTFTQVFSDQPVEPLPGTRPWAPEPLPSPGRLMALALRDHARGLARVPALARQTRRRTAAVKARQAVAPVEVPGFSGQAPRTILNDAFTPARAYARIELPLDGLKAVKDAAGVTLNDVVLAVVAGAAKRYLTDHGGMPTRPLLASCPVSSEPPDAPPRQWGNRFWSFTTSLATDVEDPWERLLAVSAVAHEAKAQLDLLGTELMPAWLDLVPPLIARPGARALVERLRDSSEDADASVLVSNIRGPSAPWRLLGSVVEDLYVDGPPSNGVGWNVMLWSYGDRMLFGVLAFADALRDPVALDRAMHDSFDELVTAASSRATVPTAT